MTAVDRDPCALASGRKAPASADAMAKSYALGGVDEGNTEVLAAR